MKLHLSLTLAAALSLGVAATAHASVVTFNNPGLVDIDNNTGVASYTEAGYVISGQAADFLPLDESLVGGFTGALPFSLKAAFGSAFSLASLDYAFYDLGDPAGDLTVTGLFNGQQLASQTFSLGGLSSAAFGTGWQSLTELTFSATSGFSLDNIRLEAVAAVPEPGMLALSSVGLLGLLAASRRRRALR